MNWHVITVLSSARQVVTLSWVHNYIHRDSNKRQGLNWVNKNRNPATVSLMAAQTRLTCTQRKRNLYNSFRRHSSTTRSNLYIYIMILIAFNKLKCEEFKIDVRR